MIGSVVQRGIGIGRELLPGTAAHRTIDAGTLARELAGIGDGAAPVVIAGGWSTHPDYYTPLARVAREVGFDDVTVPGMSRHGLDSMHVDAPRVAAAVRDASERSLARGGDGRVTLIGHSFGGPKSRWAMQRLGAYEHVGQLITLGSPHNGHAPYGVGLTRQAGRLLRMDSLRELGRGSREFVELNRELPQYMDGARHFDPTHRIVSMSGDMDLPLFRGTDGLVSVESTLLDDTIEGVHNLVFTGAGAHHGGIAGQYGMHEPTVAATLTLAGGGGIDDARTAAASFGRAPVSMPGRQALGGPLSSR